MSLFGAAALTAARAREIRGWLKPITSLLLTLTALALAVVPGAEAAVRVRGVVHDAEGRPIPVAIVTVRAEGLETKAPTDTEGRFSLSWDGPDAVAVAVEAKGYAERRQAMRLSEAAGGITFVLARATFDEKVTVTGAPVPAEVRETPASVIVMTRDELASSPSPVLDDTLREIPGFTLFRRSGSRVANPTAQGVSLRGLGGSGASRAVVIDDGIPLNDPFGGWVYWGRVPRSSVERVEVLRGGASNRFGSGALAGVVQVVRQSGGRRRLDVDAAIGTQRTLQASAFAQASQDRWIMRVSADGFTNGGYVLVAEPARGRADSRATGRHLTEEVTVEHAWEGGTRVFLRGNIFGEERRNGTPLQRNKTETKVGIFGFDRPSSRGGFTARAYVSDQFYDQVFSAVAADRESEQLTREQDVEADATGLNATWTRSFGGRTLTLGADRTRVSGNNTETAFNVAPSTITTVIGEQRITGVFADHAWGLGDRGTFTVGARYDRWRNAPSGGAERSERALSPRASILFRMGSRFSVTGTAYRAFRAPTLNELYRGFRVGDVETLANPNLEAERVRGTEAGFVIGGGRASLRATAFRMLMDDTVASVTVRTTPTLITRERRNLGSVRSQGIEVDAEVRAGSVVFAAGLLRADATVRSFSADPTLVGNRVPQVPRTQGSASIRYGGSSGKTFALIGRWSGAQFDDDRNAFVLRSMRTLDTFVALPLRGSMDVFAAGENLLNDRWDVGRTPVLTIGPPRAVRVGIRLRLASLPVVAPD